MLVTTLVVVLLHGLAAPRAHGRVVAGDCVGGLDGAASAVASHGPGAPPLSPLQWPVVAPIAALFDPPATPWSSGHRGIDLLARPGSPVAAVADGTVGFVGSVAGARWLSVDHGSRIRTTVGPIAVAFVTEGDVISAGQVVATAAGTAHSREATTNLLHFSVRVDGEYVDPLVHLDRLVATLRVPPG